MREPLNQIHADLTRAREFIESGRMDDALDLLESVRRTASNAPIAGPSATSPLWDVLSAAYETRDLAGDERTLRKAEALAALTQLDIENASRARVAEGRRAEKIRDFHQRAEHPSRHTLLVGAVTWASLLPVWVGSLFVVAAVGGSYGESVRWPTVVGSLIVFAAPWLALGWLTIRWWHEGRNSLWRPPLVWLLLLIPYFWPALLSRRVRGLLSAPRPQ